MLGGLAEMSEKCFLSYIYSIYVTMACNMDTKMAYETSSNSLSNFIWQNIFWWTINGAIWVKSYI